MDLLILSLDNLNEKFFNSKFCPKWLIKNKIRLGDYVDIYTQCYDTAYAIKYLLTGSAENGWNETTFIDMDLPILLSIEDEQHMAVYYQNNIYESYHKKYKLKVIKDVPFYKIKHDQQNFLKKQYGSYGDFQEIIFYQKRVNPVDITTENVIRRYNDLSLHENIR